jgi:hypothetical protein
MVLGEPWDGGYYGGDISLDQTGVATHHLIVAPRSRVAVLPWKTNDNNDPGLGYSRIDGPGICAAVGSSSTYPAMAYCNDLSVNGFSDWYLPAQAELEVVSRNLSPFTSTTNNGNIPAEVQTFGWYPWGVTGKRDPTLTRIRDVKMPGGGESKALSICSTTTGPRHNVGDPPGQTTASFCPILSPAWLGVRGSS